ncbi:alpha/beta fold hydrolase [Chitinophaga sp. sic0106]|uniref:alpha/beta fold hydrolase n=1 Tax=Chitinophaga sp. sic0106 TaxID=2854785 RepID=UPI001C45C9FB|nr:alpha/beta hydrolase [Chitinophaga sp. sic0106]MBV7532280.1 alpha/beta hydrolase [Chitinophaga sp. sic0106]
MSSKHLYLISGLGADERVFRHLRFPDGYEVHFLPWIAPQPQESISSYASRMAAGITAEGQVSLAGLSFGGIMSIEIAKLRPIHQTILLSSIKQTSEKPAYFNWIRRLQLTKLPDFIIFQNRTRIVEYYMDVSSPEEKQLLRDYLARKDYAYSRWAFEVILNWENEFRPQNLVHIHGDRDHPFPIKYLHPTHIIPNAGHFMVYNRAAEVSRILSEVLS